VSTRLQDYFLRAAEIFGERPALKEFGGDPISYASLQEMVDRRAAWLSRNGIGSGCRVAIAAPKSIETIALMLATLINGAAYIPLDPSTPKERLQHILRNLDPHAFIAHPDHFPSDIPCQQQEMGLFSNGLSATFLPGERHLADLAFVLYTSGSTGIPKGVCITHQNATAFIDWALDTFSPEETDRFSSIAPLYFDLSVFDFYCAFGCGGSVIIFDDKTTKNARLLAQALAEEKISITYATPSQLGTLLHFGKTEQHDYTALKKVLFAGEVFPVQNLHPLMKRWEKATFYNLYGPTETNVCTWYEIPRPVNESRTLPYPIGKICAQLEGRISRDGELLIAGPNVMPGYWSRADLNEKAFIEIEGKEYYRTGDKAEIDAQGLIHYIGRIDRMIKKRGYRIEPGEVELALLQHPSILEAAVIPQIDEQGYISLHAFLAAKDLSAVSAAELREHCMKLLPGYMIPEKISFHETLPKTPGGKIDFVRLAGSPTAQ
jgi:amino acid adenylation domain-containing protein